MAFGDAARHSRRIWDPISLGRRCTVLFFLYLLERVMQNVDADGHDESKGATKGKIDQGSIVQDKREQDECRERERDDGPENDPRLLGHELIPRDSYGGKQAQYDANTDKKPEQ